MEIVGTLPSYVEKLATISLNFETVHHCINWKAERLPLQSKQKRKIIRRFKPYAAFFLKASSVHHWSASGGPESSSTS